MKFFRLYVHHTPVEGFAIDERIRNDMSRFMEDTIYARVKMLRGNGAWVPYSTMYCGIQIGPRKGSKWDLSSLQIEPDGRQHLWHFYRRDWSGKIDKGRSKKALRFARYILKYHKHLLEYDYGVGMYHGSTIFIHLPRNHHRIGIEFARVLGDLRKV